MASHHGRIAVGIGALLLTVVVIEAEPGQSAAAWIASCNAALTVRGRPQVTYETPAGESTTVYVTSTAPEGCTAVRLPVDFDDIVWARLVPPKVAPGLRSGLMLQGGEGQPAATSEIVPLDNGPAAGPDPGRHPAEVSPAAPASAEVPGRAMWAWRPGQWRAEANSLFAQAAAWNVSVVYITVPITADGIVEDADRLRDFVRDAAGRDVQVWAVDGDPRAVLPAERPSFERRARALAGFNRAGRPGLAGIQYDIEPYLAAGYALNEAAWNEAYVATIERLAAAADMPVELAVPFWWLNARVGSSLVMDRVAGWIHSVTVMDYRTDRDTIDRLAQPWLEWGLAQRRRIRVALEAGPLPDEPRYHFRAAQTGTLWQVELAGAPMLVLLRTAGANPSGVTFAQVARSTAPASGTTFRNDIDRLRSLLPELEKRFAAFPSFSGMALHELPSDAPR